MHHAEPQAPIVPLRFDDPALFLQFYSAQIARRVVDLPTATALTPGAQVVIALTIPGATQPISLDGRLVHRAPGGRSRIRLAPASEALSWLTGYVAALSLAQPEPEAASDPDDPRDLAPRMDQLTYYEVLGVPREAEARVIQRAFHGLSRHYHPDLFFGLAPERQARVTAVFRRINEAYSVLRVPEHRRRYDRGLVGPRPGWRLRFDPATPEPGASERSNRAAYYWARAQARLTMPRPISAPPDAAALRLLRTACALDPDNSEYPRILAGVLAGRRLNFSREA